MTVDEMLSRISSRELTKWWIFSQVEPFGFEANMLGHAKVSQTIANALSDKKQYDLDDFLVRFEFRDEITIEDTINWVSGINAMFGGEDKREEKSKDT